MPSEPAAKRVQYCFRCAPELLAKLQEAAGLQGGDVNALVNVILLEGVPKYLRRIRAQHAGLLSPIVAPDDLKEFACYFGLKEALLACRSADADDVLGALDEALREKLNVDAKTRARLASWALEIDELRRDKAQLRSLSDHAMEKWPRKEQSFYETFEVAVKAIDEWIQSITEDWARVATKTKYVDRADT